MDSKISAAGLINNAANLVSFISFILWCIFYSWIITSLDLYNFFHRIFQFFSYLLRDSWKSTSCFSSKIGDDQLDISTLQSPCVLSREDVEIVMENLGLSNKEELLEGSFEIAINMFDEREASLDEVREAFGLFDENNDGYIDAEELNKVMSSIGLRGFSEQDCMRMIMAFDDNCDGRIDFGEFVKILEECYC